MKSFNRNIDKQHFKMEIITSILKLVTTNIYFTKADLKDAYYTIPILEEHQKYLNLLTKFIYINLPAYLMVIVMVHGNLQKL